MNALASAARDRHDSRFASIREQQRKPMRISLAEVLSDAANHAAADIRALTSEWNVRGGTA